VTLLNRTPRGVRLTKAGWAFLEEARRVMQSIDQAKFRARATAAGFQGTLRIALTADVGRARLSALLALSRQEEPEIKIQLFKVSLTQLVQGLHTDLFDAGLAVTSKVDETIIATPLWVDPLQVVLPARHPLLAFKEVPLEDMASYPFVLMDTKACEGCGQQIEYLLRSIEAQPTVAEYVNSHSLMLTLVSAGYGVGFSSHVHLEGYQQADVVARPLAGQSISLTTYLLRSEAKLSEPLKQFISRAERLESSSTRVPFQSSEK